jgi:hypothetical protein
MVGRLWPEASSRRVVGNLLRIFFGVCFSKNYDTGTSHL